MRVILALVISLFFVFNSVARDGERDYPGWFRVDNPVENVSQPKVLPQKVEKKAENALPKKVAKEKSFRKMPIRSREVKAKEIVEEKHFAKNNRDLLLAEKLLKQVYNNSERNFVVSPLSFYSLSVLMANGVVDESLFEFSSLFPVLHLREVNDKLKDYLESKKDSIGVYNSLWGHIFSEHYQNLMAEQLNAEMWGIADTTEPINNWAGVRSDGAIREMASVEKATSDDLFASGLAYFKMKSAPFLVKKSSVRQFFNLDGSISKTELLQGEANADYFEEDNVQVIRLSYSSGDSLTIFLPDTEIPFDDFVHGFSVNKLKPIFEKKEVKILMPKINIEYALNDVQSIYATMGISRIFEKDNYDFAKMVSFDEEVKIKKVLMKNKVSIGDDVTIAEKSDLSTKVSVEADHPFIFMINDGDFIGAYISGEK